MKCAFSGKARSHNCATAPESDRLLGTAFRERCTCCAPSHPSMPARGHELPIGRSRSGSALPQYVVGVCVNRIGTQQRSFFPVRTRSRMGQQTWQVRQGEIAGRGQDEGGLHSASRLRGGRCGTRNDAGRSNLMAGRIISP